MTLNLGPGDVLEDIKVDKSTPEKLLHRLLPAGTPGTCTILYHGNDNVVDMAVPITQPQRVATKLATDAASGAQEPNYVLDDEDDNPPARRRQSLRQISF